MSEHAHLVCPRCGGDVRLEKDHEPLPGQPFRTVSRYECFRCGTDVRPVLALDESLPDRLRGAGL